MAKHAAGTSPAHPLPKRFVPRRALPAGPQSTGALPPAPAHVAPVPTSEASPAHAAGSAHATPTTEPAAVAAPVSLKDAAQGGSAAAPRPKRNPALVVGIALLLVGGSLVLLHLGLTGKLPLPAASGAGAPGSVAVVEAVVVEPTARDLLDASPKAESLFAVTTHRELAHEATFRNVLDGDVLEDTQAFAGLAVAVGEIEDDGYSVGIVVEDLETGATFAYNADEAYYSASSIKGPYVACLYETLAESDEVSLQELSSYAAPIIISSDNAAYANMHRRFGGDEFALWLAELGCGTGEYTDYDQMGGHFYVHIDAWQLAAMWERVYTYLTSGTETAEQLAGYLEEREFSAIKMALGDEYVTWGKAGWFPDNDGYAWPATVDAGIVWAEHPYLVVVMSDLPDNMPRLKPVFAALDELHEGLFLTGTGDGVAAGAALEQVASRMAPSTDADGSATQ